MISIGIEIVGVHADDDKSPDNISKPLVVSNAQASSESIAKSLSRLWAKSVDGPMSVEKYRELFLRAVDRQFASMSTIALKTYDDFPAGLQR